jgi:hypothetical protein
MPGPADRGRRAKADGQTDNDDGCDEPLSFLCGRKEEEEEEEKNNDCKHLYGRNNWPRAKTEGVNAASMSCFVRHNSLATVADGHTQEMTQLCVSGPETSK